MNNYNRSRRHFIKQSAVLLGGALATPSVASSLAMTFSEQKRAKHIGMQLYSVRDAVKKDPKGTLQQLAAMGYKEVEPAAYIYPEAYTKRLIYGNSAKEFRKMTDDLGIKTPSSHVVFSMKHWDDAKKDIGDIWKQVIEDALTMGQKYIISPSFDADKTNLDAVKRGIDIYNKVGMITEKAGLRFGFHNHHVEFTQKFGDDYLYDIMLKGFDLKYVCQQLDIGNMTAAKVDPMRWLKMFPKHFELMHVKDSESVKFESTTLGDGIVNLDEILGFARKKTNIKYWVIEQESYGDKTPLECMKIDLDRFKTKYKFG